MIARMSLPDPSLPPTAPTGKRRGRQMPVVDLVRRLGPWHGMVAPSGWCLLLAALSAIAEVIAPAVLGLVIDRLIEQPSLPWLLFCFYGTALLFSVVFDRWSDLVEISVSGKLMAQVHVRLLSDRLLDQEDHSAEKPSERAIRLQQAATAAGELFRSGFVGPVRVALAVVATVAMASIISPALGLASLAWSLLLVATTVVIAPDAGRLSDAEQKARSQATTHAADVFALKRDVLRAGAEDAEADRGHRLALVLRDRMYARWRYGELRLMVIGAMQAGFVVTVLLVSLLQWKNQQASPGDVAAAVGLALALMDNLQWAGQQVNAALAARGVLGGVLGEWPAARRRIWLPGPGIDELLMQTPSTEHSFRIKGAWVGPLRGLTLEIDPDEHTGIVGPSDMRLALFDVLSGKRELSAGDIYFGEEKWNPANHPLQKARIARIPAHPVLLDRSIAENVWMGRRQPPNDVQKALLAFVDQLPQQWATMVGRSNKTLSAGQRLRVALGRALTSPPTWLVIDELPAGAEGDLILMDLMAKLPETTTVIIGLRKPAPTEWLSSVAVLAHGRVVEDGRPVDLLAHGTHYARWWEHSRKGE